MGRLIALGAQGDGICVVMWELLKTCARSAVYAELRVASRFRIFGIAHALPALFRWSQPGLHTSHATAAAEHLGRRFSSPLTNRRL